MHRHHRISAVIALAITVSAFAPVTAQAGGGAASVQVIVRGQVGRIAAAERVVRGLGGTIGLRISLIDGFAADVPSRALARVAASSDVASVSSDARVHMLGLTDGHDVVSDLGSLYNVRKATGAGDYWAAGFTGNGVDVAVIDSGVTPVMGLDGAGKVVNGPDLSFESQSDATRYLDTYGHGTFVAGIIAGRDPGTYPTLATDDSHYMGVAPDARIISLKVADARGGTDVSQVIAAIDWVVQHRNTDGMNIRVLNLSFGTDSIQAYKLDPLAYAVEVAWRSGIFVVVSAGNHGYGGNADGVKTDPGDDTLNDPAYDPLVLAVGASDPKGTAVTTDDVVAAFSSRGDKTRRPDVLTPGRSIVSLRVPGSYIDQTFPDGRVVDRFFRGSGTSQAAAVASGAAALAIQQRPTITPDQLKGLFNGTAYKLPKSDPDWQGRGLLDLAKARTTATPLTIQKPTAATGTGSLELSRGTLHLTLDDVVLTGERDIFGRPFVSTLWAVMAATGSSWTGGVWNGSSWTGSSWTGSSWTGSSWTGSSWTGSSWTGSSWTGSSWTGSSWTTGAWDGSSWTGSSWTGSSWTGSSWTMASSSDGSWSGASWGN
jgi:serine protease AprX